jgi:hypothetical protein
VSKKRFSTIYITVVTVALLMLIYPIFSIANRVTPLVFGLPFAFFWVILWIVITFAIVLFLFRIDPDKYEQEGE